MLTVYMDSQDFSHFSTRHKNHARFSALKAELLQLKKDRCVSFVFSDIHVYEVYPKDSAAMQEGLDRIRTISEFCEKESMPSFVSLIEHEVRSKICRANNESPPILRNLWLPNLGIENEPLERLPKPNNRRERRALESNSKNIYRKLEAEFRKNYPFIKNTDLLFKYFIYQAEWVDVVRMIENSMQDIRSFTSWIASSGDSELNLPGILRGGYKSYIDAVMTLRKEVAAEADALQSVEQKKGLASEIVSTLDNSFSQLRATIVRRLMNDLQDYQGELTVTNEMPSLNALLNYLAELIRRSSQLSTSRKPAGSDLADALHVCYLPLVDIFRTDAAAADALMRAFPERKHDIVADVFQLPIRIRERFSAKNSPLIV